MLSLTLQTENPCAGSLERGIGGAVGQSLDVTARASCFASIPTARIRPRPFGSAVKSKGLTRPFGSRPEKQGSDPGLFGRDANGKGLTPAVGGTPGGRGSDPGL